MGREIAEGRRRIREVEVEGEGGEGAASRRIKLQFQTAFWNAFRNLKMIHLNPPHFLYFIFTNAILIAPYFNETSL